METNQAFAGKSAYLQLSGRDLLQDNFESLKNNSVDFQGMLTSEIVQ